MPLSRLLPRLCAVRRVPHFCHSGAPFRRPLSSVVTAPPRHEAFNIPCRSNGEIKIDVFHSSHPSSPVIIYLPPGPVVPDCADDEEQIIYALSQSSAATIARIQYRASASHPYPTPLHDVLFGYDWVREYLLRDEFKRPLLARLGVCGELMGGSLATILALTECRLGESRIGAAAVNNPIVDWVFPDELPAVTPDELPDPMAPEETSLPAEEDMAGSTSVHLEEAIQNLGRKRKRRSPKVQRLTSWQKYGSDSTPSSLTLLTERNALFRQPGAYLDRFASPIHLFRSPHVQLVQPLQDDLLASKQPEDLLDAETKLSLDHFATFDSEAKTEYPQLPVLTRCRAYARNYPPAGTNLSLPVWHVTTGSRSPLYDQSAELTKMLRRSIARHKLKTFSGRSKWHDKSEKEQFEEYAEERVQLDTQEGFGLWTSHDGIVQGKAQMETVGAWLKHSLQPEFT